MAYRIKPDLLRNLSLKFRPLALEGYLVSRVCVARTWLRDDLRDSSGRQAEVHRTYFSLPPRTSDLHRVVLIFFFWILGLLVGRHL